MREKVKHYLENTAVGSYFEPPDYDYQPVCGAKDWYDGVYYDQRESVTCKNCKRTLDYKFVMKPN